MVYFTGLVRAVLGMEIRRYCHSEKLGDNISFCGLVAKGYSARAALHSVIEEK